MLKIYGADLSPPSNKVRFVANELGLDYEYSSVNLVSGENQSEGHLKLHPGGKVPVIDDDGFVLFESNAIIRYLAAKCESPLYPGGTKQRAQVDQWADFVSHHIASALGRVLFNRVFAPFLGQEVDEGAITENLSFLDRFLRRLQPALRPRPGRGGPGGPVRLPEYHEVAARSDGPGLLHQVPQELWGCTGRHRRRLAGCR